MNYPIHLQRSTSSRFAAYDFSNIQFGQNPTDHLFSATYRDGRWQDAKVGPFQEFLISRWLCAFITGKMCLKA